MVTHIWDKSGECKEAAWEAAQTRAEGIWHACLPLWPALPPICLKTPSAFPLHAHEMPPAPSYQHLPSRPWPARLCLIAVLWPRWLGQLPVPLLGLFQQWDSALLSLRKARIGLLIM